MIDYIESAMKAPQGPVIEGKLPVNGSTIEEVIYISNCQLVEMGWMGGGIKKKDKYRSKGKGRRSCFGGHNLFRSVPR